MAGGENQRPTYGQVAKEYAEKECRVGDPTTLIAMDEAGRLRMANSEQYAPSSLPRKFLVLIGMPGPREAPDAISSVLFPHRFRP
jgi:hypothetical protein